MSEDERMDSFFSDELEDDYQNAPVQEAPQMQEAVTIASPTSGTEADAAAAAQAAQEAQAALEAEKLAQEKAQAKAEKKRVRREKVERTRKKLDAKTQEVKDDLQKGVDRVNEVRKEIEADDRELKETSLKTRRWFIGVALTLVLAAAVVFLFSDRFFNAVQGRSSYVLEEMDASVNYIEGNTTLLTHDGNLLRCSQDGLMAMNDKGGVVYDIPFTMTAPYAVSAGDYVSVADRLGMSLVVIRRGQTVVSLTTESNILLNTVNEQGESCVVLSASNGNIVNLYDVAGNTLMQRRTYATTDGIPMALALSADGSRMATVYVNYTGSELASIITIFDLTETGSSLVDRIVGSVSFTNCVISDIKFVGDYLFYAGTDRMGEVTSESGVNTVWETNLAYEIKTLAMTEDFYVILYGDGQAGVALPAENNIVVYSYNGEVLNQFYVDLAGYVDAWNDTVIYSEGRVYYGISSTGKPKWTLSTGDVYGKLVAYENNKTVAVTQNDKLRFYKVTLRGVDGEYVD